jgi:hypothetical protein
MRAIQWLVFSLSFFSLRFVNAQLDENPPGTCDVSSFLDAIPGSSIFSDTSIFKQAIKLSGYEVCPNAFPVNRHVTAAN